MHIPQDELQKFQSGTMDTEEMIHFLEHMEQCDFCLDQLLQEEETASAPAPSYQQDEKELLEFAAKIMQSDETQRTPKFPGNRPYREYGGVPLKPVANGKCSRFTCSGLCTT